MTEFATTAGSAARAVRRFARSRRMPPGVLANPVRQRSKDQPVASVRLRWSGPNFNWEEFAPGSPLEGRDIELSASPKDIRTSPYDLCANRPDRRQSREGDRWFEPTSLQRRVHCEPDFQGLSHRTSWKTQARSNAEIAFLLKAAVPLMRRNKGGAIVNVASVRSVLAGR